MHFELDKEKIAQLEFLWERRYTLDDVGLSPKNIFDWSKQGLLLDPVKPKARRKYSIVEFIWLKLVIGLREFGVSLNAIRKVRTLLLEVIPFEELLEIYLEESNREQLIASLGEENYRKLVEEATEMKKSTDEKEFAEFTEFQKHPEMSFMSTLISYMTIEAVMYKRDFEFLIHSDGECMIRESGKQNEDLEAFYLEPYLTFSLSLLLSEFVQQQELIPKEEFVGYRWLSKKELELLNLLKKDNLVSLTVRLGQNKQIKLIEAEENIRIENVSGKITDFVMRNNYQQIVLKTQDGKTTSLRRTTKYK